MKDAYSFDLDFEGSKRSYNKQFVAYLKTFKRMGLTAIPMKADSGPIGGDMSHEFVILADTGESEVGCHRDLLENEWLNTIDLEGDLQVVVDSFTDKYAATDEERDPETEAALGDDLIVGRGIEVGHIFYFGNKYSKAMNALVAGEIDVHNVFLVTIGVDPEQTKCPAMGTCSCQQDIAVVSNSQSASVITAPVT